MDTERPRQRLLLLALAGLPLAAMLGCHHPAPVEETSSQAPPRLVVAAHPTLESLDRVVEQPAQIEAIEQTPIFVKIPGYVEQVRVEMGSVVHKGDVLATLRVPELLQEAKQKAGLVDQAKIDITLAEKTQTVAEANVRTAGLLAAEARAGRRRAQANYERWRSESARMERLARQEVIDKQSGEEAVNQLASAQAARDEADAKAQSAEAAEQESIARRDHAQAEVAAARNRVVLAESDERRAQALLGYATITAPFDGVVSDRNVHTGHFVQPNSGPSDKAEPLFSVVRIDKVRVFIEVPETDAVLVKTGAHSCRARIRVPVLNDREFIGQVAGTSWALEPSQRTLRTEIDFDNPDGELRPGMYAHAAIDVERPNTWTVPPAALLARDGETFCFIVADGMAVRTPVKVGVRTSTVIELLKKQRRAETPGEKPTWVNITGTETIVTSGAGELTDGQAVQMSPDKVLAAQQTGRSR